MCDGISTNSGVKKMSELMPCYAMKLLFLKKKNGLTFSLKLCEKEIY